MKKQLFTKFLFGLMAIAVLSCVEDDDFNLIDVGIGQDPIVNGRLTSISAVQELFVADQVTTIEDDIAIEGYVISSDEAGNFFEELFIQSSADGNDESNRGIRVSVNVRSLFGQFEVGRKVFVELEGLAIGEDGGVLTIGKPDGNEVGQIEESEINSRIKRSTEVATITPKEVTLSQLTDQDLYTLITLPSVQFTESEIALTYAGEETDEFDGERTLESCSMDGGSIKLFTSTFADFKSLDLPDASGSITAVYSKDFFGEENILTIRSTEDLDFSGERCEPSLLNPNIEATTTFDAIRDAFINSGGDEYVEFSPDASELIIEGYVISSDEKGNLFEEIYVQNTPGTQDLGANDPRLGFRISVNARDTYQTYEVGRKVYIRLNGLAVGRDGGVVTIGYPNVSEVQEIPESLMTEFVVPGEEIATLEPLIGTTVDFDEDDLGTLVQLENTQFLLEELGLTFSGEATDEFDGERTLESCGDDGGSIQLFTSTFADFSLLTLPESSGTITALYTRNFNNSQSILVINDPDTDISFAGERCDPPILDCGVAAGEGANTLFSEDWESFGSGDVSGNGWTNYAQAGSQLWENYSSGGTNASLGVSARVGSFRSGDESTIVWLISPAVDYNAQDGEVLTFQTSNSFADGSELEVLFSNDWDGTTAGITNATWSLLSQAGVVSDDQFFGDWVTSGNVDLSCAEGTGYVAFKYTGSGNEDFDGTYELDEINITAN